MKKALKISAKALALFLSILFVVEILPMRVIADAYNDYISGKEYVSDLVNSPADTKETEKADILYEVTDKRDEFTKVYKRADGTYTAAISKTPIHFEENGKWEEIDNSLEQKGNILTNKNNVLNVEFPTKLSESKEIKLENDGCEISFAVNDIDEANSTVKNSESKAKAEIEDFASKTTSAVTYNDVDDNTDIQYSVLSNGIKENIIVSDADDVKNEYSFDFNIGEMLYEQNADGSIIIKGRDGKTKFVIPSPIMIDDAYVFSYDIDVTVTENGNGSITLVYSPSKEWINSPERKFPVTIDPLIYLPSNESIEDTFVSSKNPNVNYYNELIANAGVNESDETEYYETYVKLDMSLMSILASNITPVNVELALFGRGKNLAAYSILSACDYSSVTYSNKPTLSSEVIDYYTGKDNPQGVQVIHFDITQQFNDWMSGDDENYGIAIKEFDPAVESNGLLAMSEIDSYGPIVFVDYADISGYDESYKYTTNDIGRAGTSYVNDFTRDLFITRDDLSISGNIMPLTISFMYNSALSKEINKYKSVNAETENTSVILPNSVYGERWLTSFNRGFFINPYDESVLSYYTENGSVVNFLKGTDENDNKYYYEENSDVTGTKGYSIDISDIPENLNTNGFEYIKMVRPDGNIETFDEAGRIIKLQNSSHLDQSIDIHYVNNYSCAATDISGYFAIDYITDGVGRKYKFTYNSVGLLSGIQCYKADDTAITVGASGSNLRTAYSYNSDKELTTVSFADGKTAQYGYSSGELSYATSLDSYKLGFIYDLNQKVTRIFESAKKPSDSTYQTGNMVHFISYGPHQTRINDNQGNVIIEQFDKYGRLINLTDNKGNFSSESYSQDEAYPESSGSVKHNANLLLNSSFENGGSSWIGTGFLNSAISTNYADSNTHSLKLYSQANTTKRIYQSIANPSIQTYTLSARIKSADDETTHVMKMSLYAYNQNLGDGVVQSCPVAAVGGDFQTYVVQISILGSYNYLAATFEFDNNCGEFYIDSVQLEEKIGASDYDYLTNGSFDNNAGLVSSWNANSAYVVGEDEIASNDFNTVSFAGQNSLNINKTFSQTVTVNAKEGDVLQFGGWIKSNYVFNSSVNKLANESTEMTNFLDDRFVGLKLTYSYTDIDENDNPITRTEVVKKQINDFVSDWQYVFLSTVVKGDCDTVTVSFENIKNPNEVSLANPSLNKYSGYSYDDEELVEEELEVTEPEVISGCQCSHCTRLDCTCTCEDESTCTCASCKKRFDITYDDFGNLLSMTLNGLNLESLLSLVISRAYTSDGNYKTSQVDENGHTMAYAYNRANGFLTSETDARGNTTSYQYDARGRVTKVTTPVSNLSNILFSSMVTDYVFDDCDRISAISHNGYSYKLSYDAWGNVTKINVASGDGAEGETIAAYLYGTGVNKNRLIALAYGNMDGVYYSYNDNGDLEAVAYANGENLESLTPENTPIVVYYYNSAGELVGTVDNQTGRIAYYGSNYVGVYHQDELEYYASYDSDGNFYEIINGQRFTAESYESETADNGETVEKSAVIGPNGVVGMTKATDSFSRTTNTAVMSKEPTDEQAQNAYVTVENSYSYDVTEPDGSVTAKSTVETFESQAYYINPSSQASTGHRQSYAYDYDENNNITNVYWWVPSRNYKTLHYHYDYDEANQLVRFDDYFNHKTYVYCYDRGGNLAYEKQYSSNTVSSDTLIKTVYLTYSNIGTGILNGNWWFDKLISYDGNSITYDNAGNPITYNGNTFTWRGKELVGYAKSDGTHFEYCYDTQGLRTQKKAYASDGALKYTVNYVWTDGKITAQDIKINNQTISCKFVYQEGNEAPSAVMTDTETYLLQKNLQEDVVAIIRASDGETMVSYTYDPWGKILTANYNSTLTDSDKLILKLICPFRYRGYCYDSDIGLYYLQSRYYNPNWKRFVNVDDTSVLLSTVGETHNANLFAYCSNNPINRVDYSGRNSFKLDSHKVTVNVYSGPFGHCDITLSSFLVFSYGNYGNYEEDAENNETGNKITGTRGVLLLINDASDWYKYDKMKHDREIFKYSFNMNNEEFISILIFYISLIWDADYEKSKVETVDIDKYYVNNTMYKTYKLFQCNCVTVVRDALLFSVHRKIMKSCIAEKLSINGFKTLIKPSSIKKYMKALSKYYEYSITDSFKMFA